jgi:ribosomal protein L11
MSARNETPHQIIKKLGKKKCNGSWEAAEENLTIQQVIEVANDVQDRLTGATVKARSLEIMGTCVGMRVCVEGMHPKEAIAAVKNGDFDEQFN